MSQQPPKSKHHEHMGPVWAPNFLLDTIVMRLQDPSKALGMLRRPKVRNKGPIVLMMLAKKSMSKTVRSVGGSLKSAAKNHRKF